MIDTKKILDYLPNKHGEHGVDSVIHRIINRSDDLFESYCNPPGASWAEIIVKTQESEERAWDHVPRNPTNAKRPDHIIQFNESASINFLIIESKEKIENIYQDIDVQLKNFFYGNNRFNGLLNRPMRYKKDFETSSWKYIEDSNLQRWITNTKTVIYTGFAFSFKPEIIDALPFDDEYWLNRMESIRRNYLLDAVVGVGWFGLEHVPFTRIVHGDKFSRTGFCRSLKLALARNSSI